MRLIILFLSFVIAQSAWARCPLISFTPCRPAVHRVLKAKPNPLITKHEKRIADHERRISTHDAQFKALVASVIALQRQVAELKAGR